MKRVNYGKSKKEIERGGKTPLYVVGNLPSLEQFNAVRQEAAGLKNQFIFVGSLDADRSIVQMAQAFDFFSKEQPGYELILAGFFLSSAINKKFWIALRLPLTGKTSSF